MHFSHVGACLGVMKSGGVIFGWSGRYSDENPDLTIPLVEVYGALVSVGCTVDPVMRLECSERNTSIINQ